MPENRGKSYVDSRTVLLQFGGEYIIKFAIVATGCLMVLAAVLAYLVQGFYDKKFISIEDVIIIAGFGYTAARSSYYKNYTDSR